MKSSSSWHTYTLQICAVSISLFLGSIGVSQAQEFYPRNAGSWGGVVRNGPGTNYGHIDGLQENDPVILLSNTRQYKDGYPWFEIQFKNNRQGFMWGGILCSFNQPIPGLFETCSGKGSAGRNDSQEFPAVAGSWGGIVRSGPGTGHKRLASLNEGETVTLLQRTNQRMNGYPWFKIAYRDGTVGYKWGGILCTKETAVEGLYRTCPLQIITKYDGAIYPRRTIKFSRGANGIVLKGSIIRGDGEILSFEARRGQTVNLSVSSDQNNIVLSLHPYSVQQQPISGGSAQWSGRLPHTGNYEILLKPRNGAADYELYVEIR